MEQLRGLSDSHCHLGVGCTSETIAPLARFLLELEPDHFNRFFHLMSTNVLDLEYIDQLLDHLEHPEVVVPYFGVHPWYSHLFSVRIGCKEESESERKKLHYNSVLQPPPDEELLSILPTPISLESHVARIKDLIGKHRGRSGFAVGEIGLDRLFRVPRNGFYGNPEMSLEGESVKMSSCRVTIEHQLAVFRLFLKLAEEYSCTVSLHCVKAHGVLFDEVRRFNAIPTVVLHSYSGSIDHAKAWLAHYYKGSTSTRPLRLMFSLSQCFNGANVEKLTSLVKVLPQEAILVETDYPIDQFLLDSSGRLQEKYTQDLSEIFNLVADIRCAPLNELYVNLAQNVSSTTNNRGSEST